MDLVIKFTEQSTDPDNYGKLHANLRTPFTQFSTLVIDSLTTTCSIEVLNSQDYIVFNENVPSSTYTHIQFNQSYSSLNANTISTLLNDLLSTEHSTIRTTVDNTDRLLFISNDPFIISDCSYRLKHILGLYDMTLPLASVPTTIDGSTVNAVQCLSVGNFLSTPILYLLASIGEKCFVNGDKGTINRKILMRINNSYSANFPVIANNAEFSTYALSNDFSDITFELVDAQFRPIKLLAPMYLCGTITGDPKAETINTSITVPPALLEAAVAATTKNNVQQNA